MIRAIVTDIEGTTSAIDFVHQVLFPYAAEKLPAFVRDNLHRQEVSDALVVTASEAGLTTDDTEALIDQLLRWIHQDKKVTPLKALQGLIWENGYRSGDYRAHVYPDAVETLRHWHARGLPLYVYSSGSIYAQKLFFEFSEAGNVLPLFSGHFDTTTGPKREVASYRAISEALDLPAGDIAFLSDIVEELDAASAAGMQTVWVQRNNPGQEGSTLPGHSPHQSVTDFTQIKLN